VRAGRPRITDDRVRGIGREVIALSQISISAQHGPQSDAFLRWSALPRSADRATADQETGPRCTDSARYGTDVARRTVQVRSPDQPPSRVSSSWILLIASSRARRASQLPPSGQRHRTDVWACHTVSSAVSSSYSTVTTFGYLRRSTHATSRTNGSRPRPEESVVAGL
jgi:hypothetical protein